MFLDIKRMMYVFCKQRQLIVGLIHGTPVVITYQKYYLSTDINECDSEPCQHEGTCTDKVNGYTCRCAPGYEGPSCETSKPPYLIMYKARKSMYMYSCKFLKNGSTFHTNRLLLSNNYEQFICCRSMYVNNLLPNTQ